ncbi:sulfur carrier protein ThiS [Pedobacter sp. ASV1-7]|uniref:sulfur carrier protein ThiS n=1 Tax=Pedobacter sp. ASV1-7 TaxID=3145237 RepID=UPI0032E8AEF9
MEITINNKNHQFNQSCSIAEMIAVMLPGEVKGIAVAVNQTIITKSDWPHHFLKDGDRVTLIKATQGG